MKKKLLSAALAGIMALSLAACGNSSQAETNEIQTVTEGQKESAELEDVSADVDVSAENASETDIQSWIEGQK